MGNSSHLKNLLLLLLHLFFMGVADSAACNYTIQKCGNISIPYPFGMVDNCGLPDYRISCNNSLKQLGFDELGQPLLKDVDVQQPVPFLKLVDPDTNTSMELPVLKFSVDHLIIYSTYVTAASCDLDSPTRASLVIPDNTPFKISSNNIIAVIGCYSIGNFSTSNIAVNGSCQTNCFNSDTYQFCNNFTCCDMGFPTDGAKSIEIYGVGSCGISTMLDPDTYINLHENHNDSFLGAGQYGFRLSWSLPQNCYTVKGTARYACTDQSECVDIDILQGYACNCSKGYRGDGFLNGTGCENIDECKDGSQNCVRPAYNGTCTDLPGTFKCGCMDGFYGNGIGLASGGGSCADIDECKNGTQNCVEPPYGNCKNLVGSFECSCVEGYIGDGISLTSGGSGCILAPSNNIRTIIIITGSVLSTIVVLAFAGFIVWWIYRVRTLNARKARYFKMNGGVRLKEYLSSATTRGKEALKLFSEDQLKNATQNFARHLELGRGGQGTVYKGILPDEDNCSHSIVAIKRSNHNNQQGVDHQQEVDEFINELIILSQINHRNIVQLLGCCLETPVPLLVYEYVSNGTLLEHLQRKDGRFLSWECRLAVALECAQALSYLHSSVSTPIYHRDIKSSNILLDKVLTPKVCDFGISRILPMDQTHISTLVSGTMGYLDPEYFQTFQLTGKSDVYSFGVVLLELVTSLKPVAMERGEAESNLAMLCISRLITGKFSTLVDPGLRASENPGMMGSINHVAKLATKCLQVEGKKRPSMKKVFEELLWIRGGSMEPIAIGDIHSFLDVINEDEREDLISSSQMISGYPSFNFTDTSSSSSNTNYNSNSSSNRSGLQALEIDTAQLIIKEGR